MLDRFIYDQINRLFLIVAVSFVEKVVHLFLQIAPHGQFSGLMDDFFS
ncbi:hypothetical protein HY495_01205 [Candidatus Woesearchaeota archaeon]|nr:hypothetical protein [Candidatus Woesearchaeota archaeon]